MSKSPDAFRTISEVADWLGVQAHVLRFWESKFAQVKPIKRAGGRRYYRPADMLLIGGIKKLLHDDGLTIKGAQKILREQGVAYVADLSQPLDDLTMAVIEGSAEPALADRRDTAPEKDVEATEAKATAALDDEVLPDDPDDWTPEDLVHRRRDQEEDEAASEALAAEYAGRAQEQNSRDVASQDSIEDAVLEEDADPAPVAEEASQTPSQPEESAPEPGHLQQGSTEEAAAPESPTPEPDQAHPALSDGLAGDEESLPGFLRHPLKTEEVAEQETAEVPGEEPASDGAPDADDVMPSFSARPRSRSSQPEARPAENPQEDITQADAPQSEARKPRNIELPPLPVESAMPTAPSALSALTRQPKFDADQARELRPLLARLIRHKASLASPRKEARKD